LVAIVAMDCVEHLKGCLTALAASTHRSFHVVICENAGPRAYDRTLSGLCQLTFVASAGSGGEACRDFVLAPGGQIVTLLRAPENLGYAGGVNACIAAVRDDAWEAAWVLNPDTLPDPGALAALARRQQEGGYGIVGSRLIFVGSGLVQTWGGIEWRSWLGRGRLLGLNLPAETAPDIAEVERRMDCVSGASMYVTRRYIETVGPMDGDYFLFDEDVDWCLRRDAFKLGYAHASIVRHVHGATTGSSTVKAKRSRLNIYLTERNRVLLARKRFGAMWPVLAVIALAETLEYLLRLRSTRQFGIALSGWSAGVRGETGAPPFLRPGVQRDGGSAR
jgi:N-acetylglucosaminyl-diphospho-decaprenol L-rhamnosyltransferase